MKDNQNIIIYKNANGNIKLDVHLQDESVWVTQEQMAQLFGKSKSTINEHISNIYKEKELEKPVTTQKFGNSEFQQKAPLFYNLDVIISVGYRVKSPQGTQFRIWITGFTLRLLQLLRLKLICNANDARDANILRRIFGNSNIKTNFLSGFRWFYSNKYKKINFIKI